MEQIMAMMPTAASLMPAMPAFMVLLLIFAAQSGYPTALLALAIAFLALWIGRDIGTIQSDLLADLPDQIYVDLLQNEALLALPFLMLLMSMLDLTSFAQDFSLAVRALFRPALLAPSRLPHRKSVGEEDRKPSLAFFEMPALTKITASLAVMIILANAMELEAKYLLVAALAPGAFLLLLGFLDHLITLWRFADQRVIRSRAGFTCQSENLDRPKGYVRQLAQRLLPVPILVIFCLCLLPVEQLRLHHIFGLACILLAIMTLLFGRLSLPVLFRSLNDAALRTASLFFVLIASSCFYLTFTAYGGMDILVWFAMESDHNALIIFGLGLLILALLGLAFDWLMLVLIVLPLGMAIFPALDFHSLSTHLSQLMQSIAAPVFQDSSLIQKEEIGLTSLWTALLIWMMLHVAILAKDDAYERKGIKNLASGVRNHEDRGNKSFLWSSLLIVGTILVTVLPEIALWLPLWV